MQATEMINNPPVEIKFPHPAVDIKYNEDGSLLSVLVKDEYIEKGQIKYWQQKMEETECRVYLYDHTFV